MEKRNKCFGQILGLMTIGIRIDHGCRVFDPHSFGRHDEFVGTSALHARQQFVFVGHDHIANAAFALAQKNTCTACHGVENKIVGPGFREIAQRYATRADAAAYLAGKIRSGGSGVWGEIPMPPQSLPEADAQAIAQWLADGAKRNPPRRVK